MKSCAIFLSLIPAVLAQCPILDLKYAKYSATTIQSGSICYYQNVRFGAPPLGSLRFQAPQPPSSSDPPAPKGPVSCFRVDTSSPCVASGGLLLGDSGTCMDVVATQQEDCLFLDLYVPVAVIKSKTPAPVVAWIYGGAYVFGSKDDFDISAVPLYSGEGAIDAGNDGLIFVAGNYRTGAFGWLAGEYMEQNGQPNAGFLDQSLLLSWISQNIRLVNGDPSNVSAWGESAGASSILHHLVAGGGNLNPKFRRAIVQSPAFEWLWDRTGTMNSTYTKFATYATCPNGSIKCLQGQTSDQLQAANVRLFRSSTACNGIFTVGPAIDNNLFKTLAPLSLAAGKFWKLDSLIVSHVEEEVLPTSGFIPLPIRKDPTNETVFENFLLDYFPGEALAKVRGAVDIEYPSASYSDQAVRAAAVIQDASFVCNPYYMATAYSGRTYALDYAVFSTYNIAVHAADLLPAFYNPDWSFMDTLDKCYPNLTWYQKGYIKEFFPTFSHNYQAYFASHASYGNPNTAGTEGTDWPLSDVSGGGFHNVMRANTDHYLWGHWVVGDDPIVSPPKCGFWMRVARIVVSAYQGSGQGDDGLIVQEGQNAKKFDL